MKKILTAIAALSITTPAMAIGTPPIPASCKWRSFKGEYAYKACDVIAHSSNYAGTFFDIQWSDRNRTTIRQANDQGEYTVDHGKTAKVSDCLPSRRYRFCLPTKIILDNLGVITIDYGNQQL